MDLPLYLMLIAPAAKGHPTTREGHLITGGQAHGRTARLARGGTDARPGRTAMGDGRTARSAGNGMRAAMGNGRTVSHGGPPSWMSSPST